MKKYIKLAAILLVIVLFALTVMAPIRSLHTPSLQHSTGDPGQGGSQIITPPGSIAVDIQIKPETIDLTSNGAYTIFVKFPLADSANQYPSGFETLAGQKMHMKGNVQDLELVLPGAERTIYISGSILNDAGDEFFFRGVDTVRVVY